jgi:hypothetical protein
MKVNGIVKKVFDREHKGTTYWSLCVDVDGTDEWHGFGTNKPRCAERDTVSFTSEKEGKYWQADSGSLKVAEQGKSTAPASGGGGWNDPNRQASIVGQSCTKMAVDFLSLALANGALTLGTEKATAPKKWAALNAALDEVSRSFYARCTNPLEFFGDEATAEDDDDDDGFNPVGE